MSFFVKPSGGYSGFVKGTQKGLVINTGNKGGKSPISSLPSIAALTGQNTTSQIDNKQIDELMKFDKMRHIILSSFDTYMNQFKAGQFDLLNQGFDREEALRLGQLLTGDNLSTFSAKNRFKFLKSKTLFSAYPDTTPNFPAYKSFIYTLIDGLNAATNLQSENAQLKSENRDLAEYRAILSDITRLKEYIDTHYLNFSVGLFETQQTMTTTFDIKPEYSIYINTYGLPGPEGFNAERLNTIIYNLSVQAS